MNVHEKIHGRPGQLATDLNLCNVPRWTIVPHLRHQNVAEHCWAACRIALEICKILKWEPEQANAVVTYCLLHDTDEAIFGDVPSSAKPETGSPETTVGVIVKLADWIEARYFIKTWGVGTKKDQVEEYLYNRMISLLHECNDHNLNAACSLVCKELGI